MKVLAVTGLEELERTLQKSTEHDVHISYDVSYSFLQDQLTLIEDIIEEQFFDAAIINRYMDQTDAGEEITAIFSRLKATRPSFRLILIMSEYDKTVVYPLVNAGIYDLIISEKVTAEKVMEVINHPYQAFDFKHYEGQDEIEAGINIQLPSFMKREKWKSKKLITIYSPLSKGASTMAVAITKALSKKSDKVCLVDLDTFRPSIKEKLSLNSKQGLYEAIQLARQNNLTASNIMSLLSEKHNYKVLTGLYDLNENNHLKEEYIERTLEVLQSNFEFLIVDVHSYYDLITTFVAFEKADVIYTITRGDKVSLERTMDYIKMFRSYEDVRPDVMKIVIREYGGFDLTTVEIENIVQSDVYYVPKEEKRLFKTNARRTYEKSIERLISEL